MQVSLTVTGVYYPEFSFDMPQLTGSILQSVPVTTTDMLKLRFQAKCEIGSSYFNIISEKSNIQQIPHIQEHVLHDYEMEDLKEMYKLLYPQEVIEKV